MSITSYLPSRRRTRAANPPPRTRKPRRNGLHIESLEDRMMLAANLWVTDAYLTDMNGNALGSSAAGARNVYVQAEFSTQDLPAGAQYVLRYTLAGSSRTSDPINWGAGQAGVRSWVALLGDWVLNPGAQTATAVVDANNQIPETNEADNSRSFSFTPATFSSIYQAPTKFVTPLGGTPNQDWSIVNYIDLDSGPGVQDYLGGTYSYNGHDALDITLSNFAAQDKGLPVFAAAGGRVGDLRDGEFDRNTCPTLCLGDGNFIRLDHGNGWQTFYWHLRMNSLTVGLGDVVQAGDTLGLVGSSGNSSDSHLHFAVYHNGVAVETYKAPAAYWVSPLPYSGNVPGVLDFGTTDHSPSTAELKERPAERSVFPPTFNQPVHFWVHAHGISNGDNLAFVWRRPNGTIFTSNTYVSGGIRYGWQLHSINLPAAAPLGTWSVTFLRNNVILAEDTFEVTNNAAELAGAIQFNTHSFAISENGGTAKITVTRSSPTGSASVQYTTLNQTAQAGSDFTTTTGTLTFNAGQLVRTFTVPILNNGLYEAKERFLVMLSNPTGGATLGTQWLSGVDIHDNEFLLHLSGVPGVLTVWGDTQEVNDVITVDHQGGNVRVNVNGEVRTVPLAVVSSVIVNAGAGNDTINLEHSAAGKPVTINAGTGADAVNLSPSAKNLGNLDGNVNANFHPAVGDTLTIHDQSNAANHTYTLTSTTFARAAAGLITYTSLTGSLILHGGSGATTFNVNSTAMAVTTLNSGTGVNTVNVRATTGTLNINGQSGQDTVNVSNAGSAQGIVGLINLTNAGSYTALTVDDSATAAAKTVSLGSTHLIGLAPNGIYWVENDVRSVTVRGGTGGDTFTVVDTPTNGYPATMTLHAGGGNDVVHVRQTTGPLTVNAGAGLDTINVGSATNMLDTIQGAVIVNGETGMDTLNVRDQGTAIARTYTLTSAALSRTASAQITYGTIEGLALNAGAGGDTVNVRGTAAGTPTTVNAGPGTDTINVGSVANTLATIQAALTIDGGTGTDTLNLNDQGAAAGTSYGFGSIGAIYVGSAPLFEVSNLEFVNLNAGSFDDFFNVSDNTPGAAVVINAGGGSDILTGGNIFNEFRVTAPDAGFIATIPGGTENAFTSVENLLGYVGTDSFILNDGQGVSGWIIGGDSFDTLIYRFYTSDVIVNMSLYYATGVGSFIYEVENAIGGYGNDILVGDDWGNVLLGGPGRDLMIGGGASYWGLPDTLLGEDGEDILIGGYTVYDWDLAALAAIRTAWVQPTDYYTRFGNLYGGAGGVPALNEGTVFYNYAAGGNTLQGGADLDLFFGDPTLDANDGDGLVEVLLQIY